MELDGARMSRIWLAFGGRPYLRASGAKGGCEVNINCLELRATNTVR